MTGLNVGEPEHVIEAICDDPRHRRGKIRMIATFGRFTQASSGLGQLQVYESGSRWLIWRPDRRCWSFTAWPAANLQVHRRYDADPEQGSTYIWRCKLCKRSLEIREDTLHQVLEEIYRGLPKNGAKQGVSRVGLDSFPA